MNPFPAGATNGETYGEAVKVTDQASADAMWERLVEHSMRVWGNTREDAERKVRANLGYYAGYYDPATQERVQQLYLAAHPIFGPLPAASAPSAPKGVDA